MFRIVSRHNKPYPLCSSLRRPESERTRTRTGTGTGTGTAASVKGSTGWYHLTTAFHALGRLHISIYFGPIFEIIHLLLLDRSDAVRLPQYRYLQNSRLTVRVYIRSRR